MSDAMLQDLRERCPNMSTLELIKTNMSNVSIDNLPQKLTTLIITRSMIPPRWFQHLNKENFLPDLQVLDLSFSTKTSNADLKDISVKDSIRVLKLNGCYRLTEDGLKAIAEKMTQLEELEISGTGCTEGVLHVMCRNMTNMKGLNLSQCERLTPGCLDCIGSGLRQLEWLDVSDCHQVTDDTLPHLQKMTKLKKLIGSGTEVSKEGVEKLQAMIPKCEIIIYLHETDVMYAEESDEEAAVAVAI